MAQQIREAWELVIAKAEAYLEDWESGIDDGTYDAPEEGETNPAQLTRAIAICQGSIMPCEVMSNHDAWLYAAQWGSAMTGGDPGACLYGFSEDFRVYNEEHRANCIREMRHNRDYVTKNPEHYDDDELEKIDSLIKTLYLAESKEE
jgi:hypothetical protein